MGPFFICPHVYNFIYSFNQFCSKVVLNIDVGTSGIFRPFFLLMNSISSSQCYPSMYEACSFLGDITLSFLFDTQQITTMNNVLHNSGRLLFAYWPTSSPNSVTKDFAPCHAICLDYRIFHAHFFKDVAIHCHQIMSKLFNASHGSLFLNVAKISATTASLCRSPS